MVQISDNRKEGPAKAVRNEDGNTCKLEETEMGNASLARHHVTSSPASHTVGTAFFGILYNRRATCNDNVGVESSLECSGQEPREKCILDF